MRTWWTCTSVVGGERRAGDDERLRDLACLFVGEPDHGGVGDRGVGEQQRLEFGGRDLVALVLAIAYNWPADDDPTTALVVTVWPAG